MINLPNLLNLALGVIGGEEATWKKFVGRTQDGRGKWISEYESFPVFGSWQPVSDRRIKELALDMNKRYRTFWSSNPMEGVNRGTAPDQIIYMGEVFEITGGPGWYDQNGWVEIICVGVGNEPGTP